MDELSGKVAIVTGASRGIGAAVARALAEAGAGVLLAARDGGAVERLAGEITAAGGRAHGMACDIADLAQVREAVAAAGRRLGPVDILVNNAAVIEPVARLADGDPEAWAASVTINITGAYFMVRTVLPDMLAGGGGTIVNISSGAAHRPLEGWSAYSAGKAGLAMLTQALILETAAAGMRIFGLSPGTIDTDMQGLIRASGLNPVSRIPREKLAPVGHPARAVVYLCTAAADDLAGTEVSLGDPAFRQRLGLD